MTFPLARSRKRKNGFFFLLSETRLRFRFSFLSFAKKTPSMSAGYLQSCFLITDSEEYCKFRAGTF